jgi:cell division septal protein FtsQ
MAVLFVMLLGALPGAIAAYRILPTWNVSCAASLRRQGCDSRAANQIDQILHEETKEGLWQVDVDSIRGRLRQVAWVREVEVACFTDTLRVTVLEREPLALAVFTMARWYGLIARAICWEQSGYKPRECRRSSAGWMRK